MAKRTAVTPIEIAPSGASTPALRVGEMVFVSAQGPHDPATGEVVGSSIEAQARQAMANLAAVLNAGGCTVNDCVKVTVHLADLADLEAFDGVYRACFRAPLPARTVLGAELADARVRIEATAIRDSAS